jgi:hypothetical protein
MTQIMIIENKSCTLDVDTTLLGPIPKYRMVQIIGELVDGRFIAKSLKGVDQMDTLAFEKVLQLVRSKGLGYQPKGCSGAMNG